MPSGCAAPPHPRNPVGALSPPALPGHADQLSTCSCTGRRWWAECASQASTWAVLQPHRTFAHYCSSFLNCSSSRLCLDFRLVWGSPGHFTTWAISLCSTELISARVTSLIVQKPFSSSPRKSFTPGRNRVSKAIETTVLNDSI